MSLGNRYDGRSALPGGRPPARGWLLSAALWALIFGVVHVAWATGSRVAIVDTAAADDAFDQTWFKLYNLLVAGGSFIAAAVALLTTSRNWPVQRRWPTGVLRLAGGVLLLRGAIGLLQLGWLVLGATRRDPLLTWVVDGYMLAGGGLFLVAARRRDRQEGRDPGSTDAADQPAEWTRQ